MKKVEVINVPVRYNKVTYRKGNSFEMEDEHVNENLLKVIGDVEKIPKSLEEMTVTELKQYAKENEIDLGEAKKQKGILEVIQAFEDQKQEGDK